MVKKIRIVSNQTGIGNQVQFIPFIQQMLSEGNSVISDSNLYQELGLSVPVDVDTKVDENFLVYGHNWKKTLLAKLKFKGKLIGFKYKIKKWYFSFGLDKSLFFDFKRHEINNNELLTGRKIDKFSLPGWDPIKNRIAIGISNKPGKNYEEWDKILLKLKKEGYDIRLYGDNSTKNFELESTPALNELYRELCKAEYYLGTDNGITHIADILGIPGVVIFGNTHVEKNKPYNKKIKVIRKDLYCSPCFKFKWVCTNPILYDCMKIEPDTIYAKFKQQVV